MPETAPTPPSDPPTAGRIVVPGDDHPDHPTDHEGGAGQLAIEWQVRGDAAEAALAPVRSVEAAADGAGLGGAGRSRHPSLAAALSSLHADLDGRGIRLHLAADHPAETLDELPELVADAAGLTERRELLQMRRPLPVSASHPARTGAPPVVTRPFEPGTDDAAWIDVNNRAFADHPDQGRETPDTLADRMTEPWFDPAGFLVADEDDGSGALAGFCWTKVHRTEPPLGEIYVIGVDPRHRGEGLGPSFVLAGLDHLASTGIATAMLYVDAGNTPAVRLYERLDFTVHRRRRVYTRPETGGGSPS